MATMKAALYDGSGKKMNLTNFEKPVAGPGEVVVKVRASGICGSDLQMKADQQDIDENPVGHEIAGEIVEIGEGVDSSRMGQRVAMEIIGHGKACEKCWYCRIGQYKQCENLVSIQGGGFAEYIKRKSIGCYEISDNMSWEEGAPAGKLEGLRLMVEAGLPIYQSLDGPQLETDSLVSANLEWTF